jgi:hypothetical protein
MTKIEHRNGRACPLLIAHLYYLARNYGLEAEEPAALRGIL